MKVIITGATGFVGEGVLFECLKHPDVSEVLHIGRKRYDLVHPKLKQCIVRDLMEIDHIKDQLHGYDACFYCVGISSSGLDEKTYTHITYDTTLSVASELSCLNPVMVFNFVSGKSTDSSERGRIMWARVKGKTENALAKLPFRKQYSFRPGFMKPIPGQKNIKPLYRIVSVFWPTLFPGQSCLLSEVGRAMINAVIKDYPKQILEVADIKILANQ